MPSVRSMLSKKSALLAAVRDGIQALKDSHKDYVDNQIRHAFEDSIDLDAALQHGHDQENRWDYLLGHERSGSVVGLEPNSARSAEVSTVIAKRKSAIDQLRGHVSPGAKVAAWYWVASGKVDFLPLDKTILRLDQNGITFVGRKLLQKHLDKLLPEAGPSSSRSPNGQVPRNKRGQ